MPFRNLQKRFFTVVLGALLMVKPLSPCLAKDKIKLLTEGNVKAFIEKTTDVTSTNSDNLSVQKIQAYLDKHLEKKAKFKSIMTYHFPEMPPQKTTLDLSKAEFMKSVSEGAETIDSYDTLVEIKQIKIASNGKKAFVKTENTEYASMPVPTETGGTEYVPIEGVSECTQILSLNSGVIQMYSANCTTDVYFKDY